MKKVIILYAILICSQLAKAQTAGDVLEHGIRVKSGEKIFLQFENGVLKYDAALSLTDGTHPPDFITLIDSSIFLISKSGVHVYLTPPLNPLNFSYKTESIEITDPINQAASVAMGSIIDILSTKEKEILSVEGKKLTTESKPNTCDNFTTIQKDLNTIQSLLQKNQKDEIVNLFNLLKAMPFSDEKSTILDIEEIRLAKILIENYFSKIDTLIASTKRKIESYSCGNIGFHTKYIFNSILKDLIIIKDEQKKRLDNLQVAFSLVKKAQVTATNFGETEGLKWCIKLDEITLGEGKIKIYSFLLKESGYKLSDKNEIVIIESKDLLKKTIRVRKFQRFVPEVSIGTAYTFFKYNIYGTTSDSAGIETNNQYVASPTEDAVRNINISTMINWNIYYPNSQIHPLFQVGVGINSGIPSLLVGGGLRLNNNSKNRFRISGGIAMSWIKELENLKVGDKISGTDEIEKDLIPQFSWPPKPYIALQYNF